MSGASLPPSANPPKAASDALAAATALGVQTAHVVQQHQQKIAAQRLRDTANAIALSRGTSTSQSSSSTINTSSSARGSSSLNQAYSQVWSAVTRNVRQVAVKSVSVDSADSADADNGVDEAPESGDETASDEDTEVATHTHKHTKHGERRGPGDRHAVKQGNAAQPKPKQDQQHRQKRKRRESEPIDLELDEEDGIQRVDPWASVDFDGNDGVCANGVHRHLIDFEVIEPVRRMAPAIRIENLSDANTVLRETDLPGRARSNELIWALGVLAALLLVLGVIFGLAGDGEKTRDTDAAKASQKGTQQQEDTQQPVHGQPTKTE